MTVVKNITKPKHVTRKGLTDLKIYTVLLDRRSFPELIEIWRKPKMVKTKERYEMVRLNPPKKIRKGCYLFELFSLTRAGILVVIKILLLSFSNSKRT